MKILVACDNTEYETAYVLKYTKGRKNYISYSDTCYNNVRFHVVFVDTRETKIHVISYTKIWDKNKYVNYTPIAPDDNAVAKVFIKDANKWTKYKNLSFHEKVSRNFLNMGFFFNTIFIIFNHKDVIEKSKNGQTDNVTNCLNVYLYRCVISGLTLVIVPNEDTLEIIISLKTFQKLANVLNRYLVS